MAGEVADLRNRFSSKDQAKGKLNVVRCECGFEILLVPSVKLMSDAIEAHAQTHQRRIKDAAEAEAEAERIRSYLTERVFQEASKQ